MRLCMYGNMYGRMNHVGRGMGWHCSMYVRGSSRSGVGRTVLLDGMGEVIWVIWYFVIVWNGTFNIDITLTVENVLLTSSSISFLLLSGRFIYNISPHFFCSHCAFMVLHCIIFHSKHFSLRLCFTGILLIRYSRLPWTDHFLLTVISILLG